MKETTVSGSIFSVCKPRFCLIDNFVVKCKVFEILIGFKLSNILYELNTISNKNNNTSSENYSLPVISSLKIENWQFFLFRHSWADILFFLLTILFYNFECKCKWKINGKSLKNECKWKKLIWMKRLNASQ